MSASYRAIEVTRPGEFSEVKRPMQHPGPGQVRIRVEACGLCHSDSGTVDGLFPIVYPRVPGHEVVGRVDALGQGVQGWAVGQRVGVGFLAGSCGYCELCRNGNLVNCRNQEFTGIHHDGGYAGMMIAKASGLVSISKDISSADAAPPQPPAAFIFGRDQRTIDRFFGESSFGGVPVNQTNIHLIVETMPFGGIGPAGMGQYYGEIRLRHPDTRQVDAHLPAGYCDRSPATRPIPQRKMPI